MPGGLRGRRAILIVKDRPQALRARGADRLPTKTPPSDVLCRPNSVCVSPPICPAVGAGSSQHLASSYCPRLVAIFQLFRLANPGLSWRRESDARNSPLLIYRCVGKRVTARTATGESKKRGYQNTIYSLGKTGRYGVCGLNCPGIGMSDPKHGAIVSSYQYGSELLQQTIMKAFTTPAIPKSNRALARLFGRINSHARPKWLVALSSLWT